VEQLLLKRLQVNTLSTAIMEQLLSTATVDMPAQQEQSVQTKQRVQLVNTTQLVQEVALVLPVQAEATATKRNKLLAKLVSTAT
jgi:hypothetical protein